MSGLRIRPMTAAEFNTYRTRAIREYAAAHVRAGDWSPSRAEELAAKATDDLLPDGVDTAGMLLLAAETAADGFIGILWVALEHERSTGPGSTTSRSPPNSVAGGTAGTLLRAAELELQQRGCNSIGLNLFGGNVVARSLYESSGYEITSLQMRKKLSCQP